MSWVQNAQVLAQAARLATKLQAGLNSRAAIDQAIGIWVSRVGSDDNEAFGRLRQISQIENRKLRDVAQSIVAEVIRQARAARHDR